LKFAGIRFRSVGEGPNFLSGYDRTSETVRDPVHRNAGGGYRGGGGLQKMVIFVFSTQLLRRASRRASIVSRNRIEEGRAREEHAGDREREKERESIAPLASIGSAHFSVWHP